MTIPVLDFITDVLVNPETNAPFELFPSQASFLREAMTFTADGRLLASEVLFGAIKKSGKTTTAAMMAIYLMVIGGKYAEIIIAANDFEQAQSRIFLACVRIIEASPLLRRDCKITQSRIEYLPTGAVIQAIASDYKGAAGANPTLTVIDEPWGIISEAAHRLWDELVPSPARQISARLSVSYAGFEGESDVLEKLYKRGLQGEEIAPSLYRQPGMLMAWHHAPIAPWQTPDWLAQMREQLRPNAYARMIENRWVSTESGFVDLGDWDRCVDPAARPLVADPSLAVDVGVDASTKHDQTALVAVAWDRQQKRAHLVWHRVFQPSPEKPLDFEATIEASLRELCQRFRVRSIRFDPWQMQAVAQRLRAAGLPMVEFSQTTSNLTEASQNLYELIKGHNLIVYPDAAMRLAVSRAVAIEGARGWRIAKEKASHKIDVVVALAQAALGAVLSQRQLGGGEATAVGFGSGDGSGSTTNLGVPRRAPLYLPPIAPLPPPAVWRLPDQQRRTRG